MTFWTQPLRDLRRVVLWHRRWLAAGCTAAAVVSALSAVSPRPAPTVAVLAAAHDLAGGAVLAAGDLATLRLPATAVPAGALRPDEEVSGRVLSGPVRRGEAMTDVRLVGPSLVAAYPGLQATPVRVADAASARLVQPGDLVDVLAASGGDDAHGPARRVAQRVRVLAVPDTDGSTGEGALVVLACPPQVAAALAGAAATDRLSLTIRGEA